MTRNGFIRAKKINDEIEKINDVIKIVKDHNESYVMAKYYDGTSYLTPSAILSNRLRNMIISEAEKEIEELQREFEEL